MKSAPKLIAFDLDGTVLVRGELRPRTMQALTTAHDCGAVIAVVTGRSIHMLPAQLAAAPCIDYLITSNGASVARCGNLEAPHLEPLSRSDAFAAMQLSSPFGVSFSVQTKGCVAFEWRGLYPMLFGSGERAFQGGRREHALRQFCRFMRQTRHVCSCRRCLERRPQDTLEKLVVSCNSAKDRDVLLGKLRSKGVFEAVTAFNRDIELTQKGVNKGSGLAFLMARLQLSPNDAIAFGDSDNDSSLRNAVGLFVAMGNGTDELKALADLIAPPVTEDGVAQVLEEFTWK